MSRMKIGQPSRCQSRNISYLQSQKWCQDSDIDIFVVSIRYPLNRISYSTFNIVISKTKLLQAVANHLNILENKIAPTTQSDRTIKWSNWGPDCTRWIPSVDDELNTPPASGSCVAIKAPSSISYSSQLPVDIAKRIENSLETERLHILDFNPRPIRRIKESQPEATFSMQIVTEPWTYKCSVFREDVTCRLPFRVFTSNTDYYSIVVGLNGDLIVKYLVSLLKSVTIF